MADIHVFLNRIRGRADTAAASTRPIAKLADFEGLDTGNDQTVTTVGPNGTLIDTSGVTQLRCIIDVRAASDAGTSCLLTGRLVDYLGDAFGDDIFSVNAKLAGITVTEWVDVEEDYLTGVKVEANVVTASTTTTGTAVVRVEFR